MPKRARSRRDSVESKTKRLRVAVLKVQEGASICHTSNEMQVSKTTLRRHCADPTAIKDPSFKSRSGRQPALPAGFEDEVVRQVLAWHERGLSLPPAILKAYVVKAASDLYPDNPLVQLWQQQGKPGYHWMSNFLERHPEISARQGDNHDRKRMAVTKENIATFYDLLEELLQDYPQLTSAHMFNLDKTNLAPESKAGTVLCKRGSWHSHTSGSINRDTITILPCVCADGSCIPPMVITKGSRQRHPQWLGKGKIQLDGTAFEHCRFVQQVLDMPCCCLPKVHNLSCC